MTTPITPDERAEWRALADAATPGPWEATQDVCWGEVYVGLSVQRVEEFADSDPAQAACAPLEAEDAEFIAAARTAIPRLLDALDAAEAMVEAMRPEHYDLLLRAASEGARSEMHRFEAENNALREEVARLRVALVTSLGTSLIPGTDITWASLLDEDTVRAEVVTALREHGGWSADLPDDEMDCCADAVLAVVRRHLPVRPDRETIARALFDSASTSMSAEWRDMAWDDMGGSDPTDERVQYELDADAVLALWPGESRAQVQAEALREAIEDVDEASVDEYCTKDIITWLSARADRIENGEI